MILPQVVLTSGAVVVLGALIAWAWFCRREAALDRPVDAKAAAAATAEQVRLRVKDMREKHAAHIRAERLRQEDRADATAELDIQPGYVGHRLWSRDDAVGYRQGLAAEGRWL